MQSTATTVQAYLDQLTPDRRAEVEVVRRVILDSLRGGYEEGMQYGMIGYFVPRRLFPDGYHCDPSQPLPFACLGNTKGGISLHLMCIYGDTKHSAWFREAWAKTAKKLSPSPRLRTMAPPCSSIRAVRSTSCRSIATAIDSGALSQSGVLLSRSVKRKVTVPVGKSDICLAPQR